MRTRPIILSPIMLISITAGASAGPVTFVDTNAYSEGAADPQVVVELVPNNPGPYFGGERVIVDVWLHSQATVDVWPKLFRFDFSDTSQELTLDPVFTFDFTSSSEPDAYHVFPELPRPWAVNFFQCNCSFGLIIFPAGDSLHIGSIGALLPADPDVYTVDTLNADEPDWACGARVETKWFGDFLPFTWTAFDGEIIGGRYDFLIVPEPASLTVLLVGVISLGSRRIRSRAKRPHGQPLQGVGFSVRGRDWMVLGALCIASPLLATNAPASAGPVTFANTNAYSEGTVDPQVVVELVPDNAGPYFGGERVIVDVWLHSHTTVDVWPKRFRFDFSDTSQELTLDPVFTFDFTSASPPDVHRVFPELPRPWAYNGYECSCSFGLVFLPAGGSLHIGNIGALLPAAPDVYAIDTLNADEVGDEFGAWIETKMWGPYRGFSWRAFDGAIAGGVHDFVVIPESTPLLLLTLGWVTNLLWRCGRQ